MRLEIGRRSDLALRALQLLRDAGEPMSGRAMAHHLGTSPSFLAGVMAPLIVRGWVVSRPGPGGGYVRGGQAAQASVLDVIEAIEGPLDTSTCVLAGGPCGVGLCSVHDAWLDASEALRSALAARPATRASS